MATHPRPVRRPPSLSPSRWPTLPRRGTALRLTLAALLLALAAGALYAREPQQPCPGATAGPGGPPPAGSPDLPGNPSSAADAPSALPSAADTALPVGARLPLPAGTVGVPIRLAEPAALAVVRPGARVDLLAAGTGSRPTGPALVAARAMVLDVLAADPTADGTGALYLALPPAEAHRAIALPEETRFAIMVRE